MRTTTSLLLASASAGGHSPRKRPSKLSFVPFRQGPLAQLECMAGHKALYRTGQ